MGAIFFMREGVFCVPVCAYGKKVKKSCKIGKIFCVWVLKNVRGCDIIDKNMRVITFIGRARDDVWEKEDENERKFRGIYV